MTRSKKNQDMYGILGTNFKKVLYQIHGKYLSTKVNISKKDVLEVVREIDSLTVKKLFLERAYIIAKFGDVQDHSPINPYNKEALLLFKNMFEQHAEKMNKELEQYY
jgi:hypothetical protein